MSRIKIDASALASIDYNSFIGDYFEAIAATSTTSGTSTYYGGTFQDPYGYYNGSQVGFTYTGDTTSSQVLIDGEKLAYDGLLGNSYGHGISGSIDSIVLGSYDNGTTYSQDDEAGTRSELTGVLSQLVISGLDLEAAIGSGTGSDNLVYTLYNALRKAHTVVDLDGDTVSGYEYVDQIYEILSSSAQQFIGTDGNDSYTGTAFDDRILGGRGKDTLAGGDGDDMFVFRNGDAYQNKTRADVITDFDTNGDTINLRQIDANEFKAGDQRFHFIGNSAFTGEAGELRSRVIDGEKYLFGDTDGNKRHDFAIKFDDVVKIGADDFML